MIYLIYHYSLWSILGKSPPPQKKRKKKEEAVKHVLRGAIIGIKWPNLSMERTLRAVLPDGCMLVRTCSKKYTCEQIHFWKIHFLLTASPYLQCFFLNFSNFSNISTFQIILQYSSHRVFALKITFPGIYMYNSVICLPWTFLSWL